VSSTTRSTRRAPKPAPARRISPLMLAIVAATAVAVVFIAVALQSAGGGATAAIPARTSNTEGRVLGDENAPVTIIEYADFQCPVCKRAETALIPQIEKDYIATGKVKLEFRMYPFIGQESFDAAQAAEAAGDQGKFWEYHDALFNAQGLENDGNFKYDKLVAIAQQVGLDVPKFEATLSANTHLAAVQAEADAAHAAGVSSTPTFFVGSQKIAGVQPYGTFRAAIDAALAAAAK
jgi:protein-disulfide isomerase